MRGSSASGHAGIMLERHRRDGAALSRTVPTKVTMAPISRAAGLQPRDLGADVEVLLLDPDHTQPPVTGGKKAISRAPRDRASWRTWLLVDRRADDLRAGKGIGVFRAARLEPGDQSATVATPPGSSTSSAAIADLLLDPGEIEERVLIAPPRS